MILTIVARLLQLYILLLFIRIILSWFPVSPGSELSRVVRGLSRITDPVLVPVRRALPPLRAGGAAIDLSPLIVFVVLGFLVSFLLSR